VVTAYPLDCTTNPANPMAHRYLEVTYRQGKPLAAYLALPRQSGDTSVRVEPHGPGFFVDWTDYGRPIGIEVPSPSLVTLEGLNRVLSELKLKPAAPEEVAPVVAT
jgi:hypothetical protein